MKNDKIIKIIRVAKKYYESHMDQKIIAQEEGISVSTGSACSSTSLVPSHVLSALGIPVEDIHGTLRFTVGDFTTKEDIDYVVAVLQEVVERLRGISSVNAKKGW